MGATLRPRQPKTGPRQYKTGQKQVRGRLAVAPDRSERGLNRLTTGQSRSKKLQEGLIAA